MTLSLAGTQAAQLSHRSLILYRLGSEDGIGSPSGYLRPVLDVGFSVMYPTLHLL